MYDNFQQDVGPHVKVRRYLSFKLSYFDARAHHVHNPLSITQSAATSLCKEAKKLAQSYLAFKNECDGSLEDLQYNFERMHHVMSTHHFAQLISRNGVAVLASKRGASVGEKASFMDAGSSKGRAIQFEMFDRSLQQANIRLMNAARQASDVIEDSSFQEKTLNASSALARSCVKACKDTITHAQKMLSVFGEPNMKNDLEKEFLGSEIDTVMGHPSRFKCEGHDDTLQDQLHDLIDQVLNRQRKWQEPITELMKLYGDTKSMYARDQEANKAMLEWSSNDIVKERNTVSAWIREMELTIFAQNNETKEVEFTQTKVMNALSAQSPHNLDGTSHGTLVSAHDEMLAALRKAEMDVGMNTVAVVSAYREYVEAARDVFAATVRGSIQDSQNAVKALHKAAAKVDENVRRREREREREKHRLIFFLSLFPNPSFFYFIFFILVTIIHSSYLPPRRTHR